MSTKFCLSDHSFEIELDRYKNIPQNQKDIVNFVKHWMTNSTFSLIVKLLIILDFIKVEKDTMGKKKK